MGIHSPGLYEELRALDYLMRDGEQSGRVLREKINQDLQTITDVRQLMTRCKCSWLLTMSRASFYEMMARMEDAGSVDGWYKIKESGSVELKERWYRVTNNGIRRHDEKKLAEILPDFQVGWAGT
jgi:hypothetical protein